MCLANPAVGSLRRRTRLCPNPSHAPPNKLVCNEAHHWLQQPDHRNVPAHSWKADRSKQQYLTGIILDPCASCIASSKQADNRQPCATCTVSPRQDARCLDGQPICALLDVKNLQQLHGQLGRQRPHARCRGQAAMSAEMLGECALAPVSPKCPAPPAVAPGTWAAGC